MEFELLVPLTVAVTASGDSCIFESGNAISIVPQDVYTVQECFANDILICYLLRFKILFQAQYAKIIGVEDFPKV